MKQFLVKMAVLVFTFCLGLGVSALWREYAYRLAAERRVESEHTSGLPLQLLYTDACGGNNNTQTFALYNGGQVSISCYYFSSEAAANGLLNDIAAKSEVVERSTRLDAGGRQAGETIVIASPTVMRLSTYGKAVCKTRASSLEDLRAFDYVSR